MPEIKVEIDPEEVGMDSARLERIGTHFQKYVDDGRLPGWSMLVSRENQIVYHAQYGFADIESKSPISQDTLFRIYSMTKPITSVALMILYEEGRVELTDPVSKYIPSFAQPMVFTGGGSNDPTLRPATEPMRIWHLLTHTSGLSYGFLYANPVDTIYRNNGFEWGSPKGLSLAETVDKYAGMPLLFNPGSEWNYSVSTDVLGRVIEVASNMALDEFFRTRIFEPLNMVDSDFYVKESEFERLATLYLRAPEPDLTSRIDFMGDLAKTKPTSPSGGGGLISSLSDYHRFTQMLLNRGELDGTRILGSKTVDYMTENHLPGNKDLQSFGRPIFAETNYDGVGFGLGFSVVIDHRATKSLSSLGQFGWGGAASTTFWVDPLENLTAVFMTQLLPSSSYPIRPQLAQLVYQALID